MRAVLSRPWLQSRYGSHPVDVATVLRLLATPGELIEPRVEIRRCRDAHDDMFLEAAVSAASDRLVTGDKELLAIGAIEGIAIVTARQIADEVG